MSSAGGPLHDSAPPVPTAEPGVPAAPSVDVLEPPADVIGLTTVPAVVIDLTAVPTDVIDLTAVPTEGGAWAPPDAVVDATVSTKVVEPVGMGGWAAPARSTTWVDPAEIGSVVAMRPPPRGVRRLLRTRRRRVVAGVLVLVMATATGIAVTARPSAHTRVAGAPAPSPTPSPAVSSATVPEDTVVGRALRNESVDALLATMTRALAAGDEQAFLSVVHPGSTALLARQRSVFRVLRSIRPARVTYTWTAHDWFKPNGPDSSYGDSPIVAFVDRISMIKGFDTTGASETLGLTFGRFGSVWYLVADSDLHDRQMAFVYPWDVGPVAVTLKPHVIVIGDAKHAQQEARLAARIEPLVTTARSLWPTSTWNGKVVVFADTDSRFVTTWFGARAADGKQNKANDPAQFEAIVDRMPTSTADAGPYEAPGPPRMIVSPHMLTSQGRYTDDELLHELAHVATVGMSTGSPATWVVEGLAEYTAFHGGAGVNGVQALAKRGLPPSLWTTIKRGKYVPALVVPRDGFYDDTSEKVAINYSSAWFACLYIGDHYGPATLRKFVSVAYAVDTDIPADALAAEAKAFKTVLHTTKPAFVKAVTAYARSLRSNFQ